MKLQILPSEAVVAQAAAEHIAAQARAAVAARGRFLLAVSGGRTPWLMLAALAELELPWMAVHLLQVDERVAPANDADRNLTHIEASLLRRAPIPPANVHPMPVEDADLDAACARYATLLAQLAGAPPVLDLIHLGLGPDGHTASLVPGDAALAVADREVALAGPYQGRRRMTLTYPCLNRARGILWVVTGAEKSAVLPRLLAGDATIPAGRVAQAQALLLADRAAAGQ
jgi:6-phosphogluconolactonase